MAKVMCEMYEYGIFRRLDEMTPFFIISNKSKIKGASAILNKEGTCRVWREYNTNKIVVLPSSVHEMLLVPYTEEIDLDTFSDMVGQVNSSEVDPTEQLVDRAFIITL